MDVSDEDSDDGATAHFSSIVKDAIKNFGLDAMKVLFFKYLEINKCTYKSFEEYVKQHPDKQPNTDAVLGKHFTRKKDLMTILFTECLDEDFLFFIDCFNYLFHYRLTEFPAIDDLRKWRNVSEHGVLDVKLKQMSFKFILLVDEISILFISSPLPNEISDYVNQNIIEKHTVHSLISTLYQFKLIEIIGLPVPKLTSSILCTDDENLNVNYTKCEYFPIGFHDANGNEYDSEMIAQKIFSQCSDRRIFILYGEIGSGKTLFCNYFLVLRSWCSKIFEEALKLKSKPKHPRLPESKEEWKNLLLQFITRCSDKDEFFDDIWKNCSVEDKLDGKKLWEFLLNGDHSEFEIKRFWEYIVNKFYTMENELPETVGYSGVIPIDLKNNSSTTLYEYILREKSIGLDKYFKTESKVENDFQADRLLLIIDNYDADVDSNSKFLQYCFNTLPKASILVTAYAWHSCSLNSIFMKLNYEVKKYYIRGLCLDSANDFSSKVLHGLVSDNDDALACISRVTKINKMNLCEGFVSAVNIIAAISISREAKLTDVSFPNLTSLFMQSKYPGIDCYQLYAQANEAVQSFFRDEVFNFCTGYHGYKKFILLKFLLGQLSTTFNQVKFNIQNFTINDDKILVHIKDMNMSEDYCTILLRELDMTCSERDSSLNSLWMFIVRELHKKVKKLYKWDSEWHMDNKRFEKYVEWLQYTMMAELNFGTIGINLAELKSSQIQKMDSALNRVNGKLDLNIVCDTSQELFSDIVSKSWAYMISFRGLLCERKLDVISTRCSSSLKELDVKISDLSTYNKLMESLPDLQSIEKVKILNSFPTDRLKLLILSYSSANDCDNIIITVTFHDMNAEGREWLLESLRNPISNVNIDLTWDGAPVDQVLVFLGALEKISYDGMNILRGEAFSEQDLEKISKLEMENSVKINGEMIR